MTFDLVLNHKDVDEVVTTIRIKHITSYVTRRISNDKYIIQVWLLGGATFSSEFSKEDVDNFECMLEGGDI